MPTLQDQLEKLVSGAPVTTPPTGLWERGRRYGRRRRAGSVLIGVVATAVVLAVLGSGWLRVPDPADLPTADARTALRLPDAFHRPSRWLPTADDPPGPLVAVVPTQDGAFWGGDRAGVVGVSGATGEYAFLDLPDLPAVASSSLDDSTVPALSDDGRRVAYWYVGETREEPVRRGPVLAGVAVYDTVTGEVVRRPVPTDHGVNGADLVWSGDRLWLSWYAVRTPRGNSATSGGSVAWTPSTGEERAFPRLNGIGGATGADGGLVLGDGRFDVLGPTGGAVPDGAWRLSRLTTGPVHVSPDGTRIAVLEDPDGRANLSTGEPATVLVGALGPPGSTVRLREVGDGSWAGVAGWRDDDHVVVSRTMGPRAGEGDQQTTAFASLDVSTGFPAGLTEQHDPSYYSLVLARDALAAPTYRAPDAGSHPDPRLLAGAVAAATLGGLVGVLLWRRRVRP